jgi:hypothetical protein
VGDRDEERFRDPVCEDGPAQIVELFSSRSIQKQYATHLMICEMKYGRPEFRKKMNGSSEWVKPNTPEISRFRIDVYQDSLRIPEIADFIRNTPGLEPPESVRKNLKLTP